MSAAQFASLLAQYAGKTYDRRTIYNWERAERQPLALPPHYWRKLYASAKAIAAMHRLITDLVAWASNGRYRARVTGKRIWRVKLIALRAITKEVHP